MWTQMSELKKNMTWYMYYLVRFIFYVRFFALRIFKYKSVFFDWWHWPRLLISDLKIGPVSQTSETTKVFYHPADICIYFIASIVQQISRIKKEPYYMA